MNLLVETNHASFRACRPSRLSVLAPLVHHQIKANKERAPPEVKLGYRSKGIAAVVALM